MINLSLTGIVQERVYQSRHLVEGLNLINQWTSRLVLPDGVVGVIAGGAVRDAVFKNTTPHDVDIFFVAGSDRDAFFNSTSAGVLLLENIYMWLEDEGISWRSLIRETYHATSDISYSDIIEFEKDGITYQLMLPAAVLIMDGLVDRFPVMCRAMLSTQGLHVTLPGFLAMKSDVPVGYNARDFAYIRKKYLGQEYRFFSDINPLFYYLAHTQALGLQLEFPTNIMTESSSYPPERSGGAIASIARRILRMEFGIDSSELLDNVSPNLPSRYTTGRVRPHSPELTAQRAFNRGRLTAQDLVNAMTSVPAPPETAARSFSSLRSRFS